MILGHYATGPLVYFPGAICITLRNSPPHLATDPRVVMCVGRLIYNNNVELAFLDSHKSDYVGFFNVQKQLSVHRTNFKLIVLVSLDEMIRNISIKGYSRVVWNRVQIGRAKIGES